MPNPLPAACTPCGFGSLLLSTTPSRGESDSRGLRQGPALYTLDAAMAAVWPSSPKQYHCSSTLELASTLGDHAHPIIVRPVVLSPMGWRESLWHAPLTAAGLL